MSNPIFTVLIAWIILGDAITGGTAVAIIAVLLGLVLVSYIPGAITGGADPSASTREANSAASTGEAGSTASKRRSRWRMVQFLLPLTSSLVYAIGNVLRGVGVQLWNEPIIGAFLGAAGGFVLYVFTSPVVWRLFRELQRADRMGAGLYALGGMLTIGAQTCVIAAMRHIPISIANLITLSTPVVVTPVSYLLFRNRERIMIRTVLGLTLVMGGMAFLVLK